MAGGADFGIAQPVWDAARDEAKALMIARARRGRLIAYSELVADIKALKLEPRDPRLFALLGEISTEETAAGRGMLTAVVVQKSGDKQPGPGFFELAQTLGHKTSNPEKFWIAELQRVYAAWAK